jgi:hypothetical protein
MEFSFGSSDIEKWAQFSGDRNPIHFQPEAAARLGVEKVVAHGMLALLPVKQQVVSMSDALDSHWTQFKASFKAPILKDDSIVLSTKARKQKLGFKVDSVDLNTQHLVGHVCQIPVQSWCSDSIIYQLDKQDIRQKYSDFCEQFDNAFAQWIWLDGLVFGHFISHQIGYIMSKLGGKNYQHRQIRGIEDLSDHMVVQISHQTVFCNNLKDVVINSQQLPDVAYQIDNINVTENNDSAFGTLDVGVLVNGCHQMTIELGLMIKSNPQ